MGASDTISVTQTIPANAGSGDSESVTFNVINGDGSSTSVQPLLIKFWSSHCRNLDGLNPGGSGDLSFTVTNTGNGFDTFTIGTVEFGLMLNQMTLYPVSGSSATVDITVTIPADSQWRIFFNGLSATSSGAASTDSYDVVVASSTRSLVITGGTAYTFNQGTIGQGTATIQNTGVSTTFIVPPCRLS